MKKQFKSKGEDDAIDKDFKSIKGKVLGRQREERNNEWSDRECEQILKEKRKTRLIILERLKKYSGRQIGKYQYGFREGRFTIDAIHVMNQVIQKCCEQNIGVHVIFVDFEQVNKLLIA